MKTKRLLTRSILTFSLFSLLSFSPMPKTENRNNGLPVDWNGVLPASVYAPEHTEVSPVGVYAANATRTMVKKNLVTGVQTSYSFNPDDYTPHPRPSGAAVLAAGEKEPEIKTGRNPDGSTYQYTEPYFPNGIPKESRSTRDIIGTDDRVRINNPKDTYFYCPTGFILTKYANGRSGVGSGSLNGLDYIITAAHCVFGDTTDDGIHNPRFADEIEFYPARDGSDTPYLAKVIEVNIPYDYYANQWDDWAICLLDSKIGYQTGYYGKRSYGYETGHSICSPGYPGEKQKQMWLATGKFTKMESNGIYYQSDMDATGGQSGSPLFLGPSDWKVAGIVTYESGSGSNKYTGGPIIDAFKFAFMQSFVI